MCANGQSIVFVAENNVGVDSNSNTEVQKGPCFGQTMTTVKGIIHCDSLSKVRGQFKDFKFPDFNDNKCNINNQGDFLEAYLKFR